MMPEVLTKADRRALDLIARGYDRKAVARRLGISDRQLRRRLARLRELRAAA